MLDNKTISKIITFNRYEKNLQRKYLEYYWCDIPYYVRSKFIKVWEILTFDTDHQINLFDKRARYRKLDFTNKSDEGEDT